MSGFSKVLFSTSNFRLKPLLVAMAFVFLGRGAQAEDLGSQYHLCKLNKEVRTLRIEKQPDKCEIMYNKYGKDQVVGAGQNHQSCEEVLTRVRGNLEKAGWKCREIKDASVSDLGSGIQ